MSGGGGGGLTRHRSGLGAAAALQPAPVPCSTAAHVTLVLLQSVCSVWDHAPFAHCTAGVHTESVCLLTKFLGKMTACGNIHVLCGRQNRGAQEEERFVGRARFLAHTTLKNHGGTALHVCSALSGTARVESYLVWCSWSVYHGIRILFSCSY